MALCLRIKKKLVQGLLLWVGSKYLLNMEDHRISIETIFNSNGLLIIKPQKILRFKKIFPSHKMRQNMSEFIAKEYLRKYDQNCG